MCASFVLVFFANITQEHFLNTQTETLRKCLYLMFFPVYEFSEEFAKCILSVKKIYRNPMKDEHCYYNAMMCWLVTGVQTCALPISQSYDVLLKN